MSEKRIRPKQPKREYYEKWLSTFQCVDLFRRGEINFWNRQVTALQKYTDELMDGDPLKIESERLITLLRDNCHYFMCCPSVVFLKNYNIIIGERLTNCPQCDGYGFKGDKLAWCTRCRGWGYMLDWIFKKYDHRHEKSLTIITRHGHEIVDVKEIGVGFWSIL